MSEEKWYELKINWTEKYKGKIKNKDWFNIRLDTADKRISKGEDVWIENIQTKTKEKNAIEKSKKNIRDILDMVNISNICEIVPPQRGEKLNEG